MLAETRRSNTMGQPSSSLKNCSYGRLGPNLAWDGTAFVWALKGKNQAEKFWQDHVGTNVEQIKSIKITQICLHIISIWKQLQYFALLCIKGFETFEKQWEIAQNSKNFCEGVSFE